MKEPLRLGGKLLREDFPPEIAPISAGTWEVVGESALGEYGIGVEIGHLVDNGEEGGREIVGAEEGGEGGGRRRCGCEAIAAIVGVWGGVDGVIDGVIEGCIGCTINDGCIGYIINDGCIIVDGCVDERIVRDSDWSIIDTIAIDGGCIDGIVIGGSSSDRYHMSNGILIDNALIDHTLSDDGILLSNDRCLLHNILIHILVNVHILFSTTILLINIITFLITINIITFLITINIIAFLITINITIITLLLIATHSQHNLRIRTKLLLPRTTPTLVHIHVLALLTQRKHRLRTEHPVHLPLQHR